MRKKVKTIRLAGEKKKIRKKVMKKTLHKKEQKQGRSGEVQLAIVRGGKGGRRGDIRWPGAARTSGR